MSGNWQSELKLSGNGNECKPLFLGYINLPINLAPFGSLIFCSIIVPQASFIGHLAGIVMG